jgi:predicted MFS family arabinose efflux permease
MISTLDQVSQRPDYRRWILFAIINAAGFLAFAKVSEIPPIIPALSQDLKLSYERLSLLVTAYTVTRLVGSSIVGWLSDRWGFIRMIAVGLIFLGIFGFLPTLTTNYPLIVSFRVLQVCGVTGIMVAGMDAMTKIIPGSRMGLGIGIFDGSVSLGAGIAYLLSPILTDWYGWRLTLRLSSFASLVLLIPLLSYLKRNHVAKAESLDSLATITYHKSTFGIAIILLSAAMGLVYFQGYGVYTWTPAYLTDVLHYSSYDVGTSSMFFGLLAIPSAIISGRLSKSFRSMVYVSLTGALISTFGIMLLVARQGWSKGAVIFIITLITWGRTQSAVPIISLVALTSPTRSTGKALGQVFAVGYLGATVSTYLGGHIITRSHDYNLTFILFAVASFSSALVIILMKRLVGSPESGHSSVLVPGEN